MGDWRKWTTFAEYIWDFWLGQVRSSWWDTQISNYWGALWIRPWSSDTFLNSLPLSKYYNHTNYYKPNIDLCLKYFKDKFPGSTNKKKSLHGLFDGLNRIYAYAFCALVYVCPQHNHCIGVGLYDRAYCIQVPYLESRFCRQYFRHLFYQLSYLYLRFVIYDLRLHSAFRPCSTL